MADGSKTVRVEVRVDGRVRFADAVHSMSLETDGHTMTLTAQHVSYMPPSKPSPLPEPEVVHEVHTEHVHAAVGGKSDAVGDMEEELDEPPVSKRRSNKGE